MHAQLVIRAFKLLGVRRGMTGILTDFYQDQERSIEVGGWVADDAIVPTMSMIQGCSASMLLLAALVQAFPFRNGCCRELWHCRQVCCETQKTTSAVWHSRPHWTSAPISCQKSAWLQKWTSFDESTHLRRLWAQKWTLRSPTMTSIYHRVENHQGHIYIHLYTYIYIYIYACIYIYICIYIIY